MTSSLCAVTLCMMLGGGPYDYGGGAAYGGAPGGAYVDAGYGGGGFNGAGIPGGGIGGYGADQQYPFDSPEPWLHGYFQEMPSYGGYYYFRPYNYKHVLAQSQAAGRFGTSPMMPYSQQFWHRYQQRASMKQRMSQIDPTEYSTEMARLQAWSDFLKQQQLQVQQQQATQAQFQQPPANYDQRQFQEPPVARREYDDSRRQPQYGNLSRPVFESRYQPANGSSSQPTHQYANQPSHGSQPQQAYGNSTQPVYGNQTQSAYGANNQPGYKPNYIQQPYGAQGPPKSDAYGQPPVDNAMMSRQPAQLRYDGNAVSGGVGPNPPQPRFSQNSATPQRPVDPAMYRQYSRVEELEQQIHQQRMQLQALQNSLQQQQFQGGTPTRR